MFLKVRPLDGSFKEQLVDLKKSATVNELRKEVSKFVGAQKQFRLLVKGKVLNEWTEEGELSSLFVHYDIKGDEVIQVLPGVIRSFDAKEVNQENEKEKLPEVQSVASPEIQPMEEVEDEEEDERRVIGEGEELGSGFKGCTECGDDRSKICFCCNCVVCGIAKDDDKTVICDGYDNGACDRPYHIYCIPDPHKLDKIPEEDWLCPECQADVDKRVKSTVLPEQAAKKTKKKEKTHAATTKRQWGGGVSCSGVGQHDFDNIYFEGAIPNVEVGQVAESERSASAASVRDPRFQIARGLLHRCVRGLQR